MTYKMGLHQNASHFGVQRRNLCLNDRWGVRSFDLTNCKVMMVKIPDGRTYKMGLHQNANHASVTPVCPTKAGRNIYHHNSPVLSLGQRFLTERLISVFVFLDKFISECNEKIFASIIDGESGLSTWLTVTQWWQRFLSGLTRQWNNTWKNELKLLNEFTLSIHLRIDGFVQAEYLLEIQFNDMG